MGQSNKGPSNRGPSNTGHSNTGHSNTGHSNTGHSNTGQTNRGQTNLNPASSQNFPSGQPSQPSVQSNQSVPSTFTSTTTKPSKLQKRRPIDGASEAANPNNTTALSKPENPSGLKKHLYTFISSNYFLNIPPDPNGWIIFLLPGNPGLITYYLEFLKHLSDHEKCPAIAHHVIAGFSHAGFEKTTKFSDNETKSLEDKLLGSPDGRKKPYSLEEQVEVAVGRLKTLVMLLREDHKSKNWKIILIGHSAGAYIALDVLQSLHEEEESARNSTATEDKQGNLSIPHALLIAPTIVRLGESSGGRVGKVILQKIPEAWKSVNGHYTAEALEKVTGWLVKKVVQSKEPDLDIANREDDVDSAVRKLSLRGLAQCIHMAREEVYKIKDDKWNHNIWRNGSTELTLCFAKPDPFVSTETRDWLIEEKINNGMAYMLDLALQDNLQLTHFWPLIQATKVGKGIYKWVRDFT